MRTTHNEIEYANWPGDSVESENANNYPEVRPTRIQRVVRFTRSRELIKKLIPKCISSIPRWNFFGSAHKEFSEDDSLGVGVTRAIWSCLRDCNAIFRIEEPLAERLRAYSKFRVVGS